MKLSPAELTNLVRSVEGCAQIVRNVLGYKGDDPPEITHIAVRLHEAHEYAVKLGSHLQSRQAIAIIIMFARAEWQNKRS